VEDTKDDIVDKELLMKLKTSKVLIVAFDAKAVCCGCKLFTLKAIYRMLCFILQITDPFARKFKTEDKRKNADLHSIYALLSKPHLYPVYYSPSMLNDIFQLFCCQICTS
jgi:hypothetical protein